MVREVERKGLANNRCLYRKNVYSLQQKSTWTVFRDSLCIYNEQTLQDHGVNTNSGMDFCTKHVCKTFSK